MFCLFPPSLGVSRGTWVCVHVFSVRGWGSAFSVGRLQRLGVLLSATLSGSCKSGRLACHPPPIVSAATSQIPRMLLASSAGSSPALNLGHQDTPGVAE